MSFITNKPQRRTPKDLARSLTDKEKLENLDWFMSHCDNCQQEVTWGAKVCEHCGYELAEFGKQ